MTASIQDMGTATIGATYRNVEALRKAYARGAMGALNKWQATPVHKAAERERWVNMATSFLDAATECTTQLRTMRRFAERSEP